MSSKCFVVIVLRITLDCQTNGASSTSSLILKLGLPKLCWTTTLCKNIERTVFADALSSPKPTNSHILYTTFHVQYSYGSKIEGRSVAV